MYSAEGANFFNSMSNLTTLILQLSQISGAEVAYKTETGSIEVIGSERAIRNVYQHINGMNLLKVSFSSCIHSIYLSPKVSGPDQIFLSYIARFTTMIQSSLSSYQMNSVNSSAGKRVEKSTKS